MIFIQTIHDIQTKRFNSWSFFYIRGTRADDPRAVETQFRTGNPDPYPVQHWRTDLGTLVVMSTSRFCYRYSSVQSKMNNAPKRPMETTSMHVNLTNRQCIRVDMAIQVGKGGSAIWFENISPLANK